MARNIINQQDDLLDLVYPVFLNVPMLTSFIAALEDGVAFEADRSTSTRTATEKSKLAEGTAKIAGAFSGFLGFDMKGQLSNKNTQADEETIKVLRKHTEASLFMRFRQILLQNDLIHSVDYLEDSQIKSIQKGSFIEISGILERSFVKEAFDSIDQMISFASNMPDTSNIQPTNVIQNSQQRNNRRQNNNQRPSRTVGETIKNDPNWKIFETLKQDISNPSIQDITLVSVAQYDGEPIKVIIPFLKSEFTDTNFESVRYSEIKLLGKVISKDLEGDSEVNLLRRAVIGNMPKQNLIELLEGCNQMMNQINSNFRDLSSPFVVSPWLEVLPIALFV